LQEVPIYAVSGLAAATLQLMGFLRIAAAVRSGRVHPNQFSWLIWSVVATLAAAGSFEAGATWPLAGAAMNAAGCIAIFTLALRHGSFRAVSWPDLACLFGAAVGLAAWSATSDPTTGLLLFLGADACGALPTIRNVARDHRTESIGGWALLALAGVAALASVEAGQWLWSWQGFGYWGGAVYVALVNVAITATIAMLTLARAQVLAPRASDERV
jgi:hypothetical protein